MRKVIKAVSVIGGADGPTSVFVAGRLGESVPVYLIMLGIVLLVIAGIIFLKRKH